VKPVSTRSGSGWRQLLSVCSLPGLSVVPIAVLNNSWTALMRQAPWDHLFSWTAAWKAAPFEGLVNAALAACAVALVARRQGGGVTRARALVLVSAIALLAGGVAAYVGEKLEVFVAVRHAAHVSPGWFWHGADLSVAFLVISSLGLFHFAGLLFLLGPRLLYSAATRGTALAAWVVASATIGGLVVGLVWFGCLRNIGVGGEGPGDMTLFVGTYFTWGARFGACVAHQRLAERLTRAA